MPLEGEPENYLQIYIMGDEQTQIDRRANVVKDLHLDRDMLEGIQGVLTNNNDLLRESTAARERNPGAQVDLVIRADQVPA